MDLSDDRRRALIAWAALFAFLCCLAACLAASRGRERRERHDDAFTNAPSNALPHPVTFPYPWDAGEQTCAAAGALQYALMYKRSPAMTSDDAQVSRAFLSWAATGAISLPDLALNDMLDVINRSGWIGEDRKSVV